MKKTKIIILASIISIFLLVLINFTLEYFKKETYKTVYILNRNVIEGENIKAEDVNLTSIKETKNKEVLEEYKFEIGYVAKYNMNKGQILYKDLLDKKENYAAINKNFEAISIPIEDSLSIVGYQIKKGDKVNVYATAKTKDINNLYTDFKKTYSSSEENSYVTFKVFENIKVKELIDESGKKLAEGKCTEIILMIEKSKIEQYINLKQFAKFNITKEGV